MTLASTVLLCTFAFLSACYDPRLTIDSKTGQHAECRSERADEPPEPSFEAGELRYNAPEPWCEYSGPRSARECSADTSLRCAADARCALVNDDTDQTGYCLAVPDEPQKTVAITYRDGDCAAEVADTLKAALCCEGVGVDCRRFPLAKAERRSKPGELCTRHAECEVGLLCAETDSPAIARCVCPGVDAKRLPQSPVCYLPK